MRSTEFLTSLPPAINRGFHAIIIEEYEDLELPHAYIGVETGRAQGACAPASL